MSVIHIQQQLIHRWDFSSSLYFEVDHRRTEHGLSTPEILGTVVKRSKYRLMVCDGGLLKCKQNGSVIDSAQCVY